MVVLGGETEEKRGPERPKRSKEGQGKRVQERENR